MNKKLLEIIKNNNVTQFSAVEISLNGAKLICKLNVAQSIIAVPRTKFISLLTSKCLDTYFSDNNNEEEDDEIDLPQAFHLAEEEEQLTNGELFSDYSQKWTSQNFNTNQKDDDNFDAQPLIGEDRTEMEIFFFLLPLLLWKEILVNTNWKKQQLKLEGDDFTMVELLTYVNIRLCMAINRKNSKDKWEKESTGYAPGFNFSKIMAL